MRIAYIVPALANKGPVIVVKELVSQMTLNGHKCMVFYFDDIVQLDFECPTQRINIRRKIDFSTFDIVHSHGLRSDFYVFFHAKRGKTRFVTTLHNYMFQDLKYQYNCTIAQIFGRIWLRILGKHDRIVTLSKDAFSYYCKWLPQEKLSVVYNTRHLDLSKTLDDVSLTDLLTFKGNDTLIGVNALLTYRKGLDILIKALPYLPYCKLFIVGDGPARNSLEVLSKHCGVSDRCRFTGYKPDGYRYLKYYDIFAMPSRSEGFPLALLEAAIYRKRCVVSDIPVITESFTSKEVSFFNLSNSSSIIQAINRAISDVDLEESIYQKYQECYSPSVMYNKYISIYDESLSK